MRSVLITGVAGFIGMHTAIRFLKEGWVVVGVDNFNDYYSVTLKLDRVKEIERISIQEDCCFEIIKADINSDFWNSLDSYEFEIIVHLAAQAGVRYSLENPRAYLSSNILGFQSVLEFVSKRKNIRFLYASSSSVYGKNSSQPFSESAACDAPESYYAATKRANELMARSYFHTEGMASIGLRFFTVYGPWGRPDMAPMLFVNAGLRDQAIKVFNHGDQERDFTYIEDIVNGVYLLATMENFPKKSVVCNIGNGSPIGLLDFISIVEKSMGRVLKKEFVPAQKGDVQSTYSDTKLLESFVDYKPSIGLGEGIPLFIDWFKSYYKLP